MKRYSRENKGRIYALTAGLLALALVLSMWLPSVFLTWQDRQRLEKSRIEPTPEVELTARVDMSMMEKVHLLQSENINVLSMTNGKHYTWDTITAKVRNEFGKLKELGIIQDDGLEELTLDRKEVFFVMNREDSEQSMLYWSGYAYTENFSMEWVLDDETGKILELHQWDISTVYKTSTYAGSEAMKESELLEIAEKWAEYLECQVVYTLEDVAGIEAYDAAVDNGTQFANELSVTMKSLMKKGISESEAYQKAMEMLGYPIELQDGIYVLLEDEQGTAGYWIQRNRDDSSLLILFGFF